jgi:hypothetical protein
VDAEERDLERNPDLTPALDISPATAVAISHGRR